MASLPPPSLERPSIRISSTSGRVDVLAEARTDIDVRGDAAVTRIGASTTITGGHGKLAVRVPIGIDVVVGTTSGRVEVAGEVGAADVATANGRISLRDVRGAETLTGHIDVSMPRGVRAFCTDIADGPVERPHEADCVVATHSVTGRVDVANR